MNFNPNGYVVHVAGPRHKANDKQIVNELLECCVLNILDAAKDLKVRRVAIPSISVGQYNFPADEAGEIMIKTIFKWCHLKDTG